MLRPLFLSLVTIGLGACQGTRSEDPPVHLNQNMDFQERGDAQEANAFFADGRVMRTPPAGTVAVGHLNADDHLYRGRNLAGVLVDELPRALKLDEAFIARGEARYNIYCAPCHGVTGHGDGQVTRRGGTFAVAPADLHIARLRPEPLGYFFHVISNGKGKMRSYKAQIPVADRWAIAAWVRTLQFSTTPKAEELPPGALAVGAAKGATP